MSKGVVIDDFLIEKLIGEGGMGNVYLAHQFTLDREVALKILKDELSENQQFKVGFIKEARSVASLNHPNIIQAFKVGEEAEVLYFATEFVEGDTLDAILTKEGNLEENKVLEITLKIAEALGYAWDKRQLVHRDIKPENIMITDSGQVKLMDLGLSCTSGEASDDGDIISGTPQYISPEQILGNHIDIRTDFYCLGATLYHLLSGVFPFTGDLQEMVRKHIQEYPPSLKKKRPELSGDTVKMVHCLMCKNPGERYASAQDLIKEIHRIQKQLKHPRPKKRITLKNVYDDKDSIPSKKSQRHKKKKHKSKNTVVIPLLVFLVLAFVITIIVLVNSNTKAKKSGLTSQANLLNEKANQQTASKKTPAEKTSSKKISLTNKTSLGFPLGSLWFYYDKAKAPSAKWKSKGYDHTKWKKGKGQFGYGDKDETTVLNYGSDSKNKRITYYFRKVFNIKNLDKIKSINLSVIYDDGIVVYLNNKEITRLKMPEGNISHDTLAKQRVNNKKDKVNIPLLHLIKGDNVVAVEVHNYSQSSSDLSFDAELQFKN